MCAFFFSSSWVCGEIQPVPEGYVGRAGTGWKKEPSKPELLTFSLPT